MVYCLDNAGAPSCCSSGLDSPGPLHPPQNVCEDASRKPPRFQVNIEQVNISLIPQRISFPGGRVAVG